MHKRMVEIEAEVIAETDMAILIDDGIWLPKSQLEDWPSVGGIGVIIMPEWLAEDKELI